jgi:predicted phage terminase large subunit-like protein
MSNRVQNADRDAIVIIQQRTHDQDVSGVVISEGLPYEHLMIPWSFDSSRQVDDAGQAKRTSIGWCDPRWQPIEETGSFDASVAASDGTPAWSERFSDNAIARMKLELGSVAWAGQYEQSPKPRGGTIFDRLWFNLWVPEEHGLKPNVFPVFDYIVASLDSAFTEREENDPSALTVWGVFELPEASVDRRGGYVDERSGQVWSVGSGRRRIMLIDAWRKHLQFSGPRVERAPNEIIQPGMPPEMIKARNARFRARTQAGWGLIEWVRDTCRRRHVHKLLIEAKASGVSAAQELRNRFNDDSFRIELVQVKGDKLARAYAAQATFSAGLVWAPMKDWSEMVICEMETFPRSRYRDLTDSATQAIAHLRARGLAATEDEQVSAEIDTVRHTSRPPMALYPI